MKSTLLLVLYSIYLISFTESLDQQTCEAKNLTYTEVTIQEKLSCFRLSGLIRVNTVELENSVTFPECSSCNEIVSSPYNETFKDSNGNKIVDISFKFDQDAKADQTITVTDIGYVVNGYNTGCTGSVVKQAVLANSALLDCTKGGPGVSSVNGTVVMVFSPVNQNDTFNLVELNALSSIDLNNPSSLLTLQLQLQLQLLNIGSKLNSKCPGICIGSTKFIYSPPLKF